MKQSVEYCGNIAGIVQIGSRRLGPEDRTVTEGEPGVDRHTIAYLLSRGDFKDVPEQPKTLATTPDGEEG